MECEWEVENNFYAAGSLILLINRFSGNKITAILLCVGVIAINLVFVVDQVTEAELNPWYMVLVGE